MAGNLLGQGFSKYVIEQINVRQDVYGSINRTPSQIQYINNKTAFLRLSSGTEVTKEVDGLTIKNTDYVLFNGISRQQGSTKFEGTDSPEGVSFKQLSGITRQNTGSIDTSTAYGFGGLDYGQSPMPGLTSANIKSLNRGALREGEISIKAFNTTQFNIIDSLYLRLGHYILLEWGWSNFFDNSKKYVSNFTTDLSSKFMEATTKIDDILSTIEATRLTSGGNYDALLAKVVNFSWSRAADGTYDISLKVRGIGDVIESLKINVLTPDAQLELKKEEEEKDKEEQTDPPQTYPADASSQEIIRSAAYKSTIGNYFYTAYRKLRPSSGNISTYTDPELKTELLDFAMVNYEYPGFDGDDRELYIRLGSLLTWLQKTVMLAFTSKNKAITKALTFNNDVEKNLIYIDDLQLPVDPRICIFNRKVSLINSPETVELFPGLEKFESDISFNDNQYGQIMNLYVNCGFILKKIDEAKDKDGNTALISFLNNILSNIATSMGGNNRLEATINPEKDNEVVIIDNNQLPDRDEILKKFELQTDPAIFEVYGYRNVGGVSKAGFVKTFDFKTEMTPEMSTMVTVGGTSNGNTSHQDSTALSAINAGTINLYAEEAKDNETPTVVGGSDEKPPTLEEQYKETIEGFNEFIKGLSQEEPEYDPEDVDSYKNALQQMVQYKEAKSNEGKKDDKAKTGSRNIGFIPFNLTLTLEGLSGVKIYQKYLTDGSFLPSSYPDTLDFLVKGVSHKIESNRWETTLESLAVPKKSGTPDASERTSPIKVASRGNVNTSSGSTSSNFSCPVRQTFPVPPTQNPASSKRRQSIIKAYKYTFYNDGKSNQPKNHLCSKYTYTHAYNYTSVLNNKTKQLKSGGQIFAGGNANQPGYWVNLVKLGYTQTQLVKGGSKSDVRNLITNTSYNYGDVIVYWALDNPYDKGASQYGHTQMYIGGAINGVTWTSDRYTNYNNSPFVYNSKSYNCWNLILFRAPNV